MITTMDHSRAGTRTLLLLGVALTIAWGWITVTAIAMGHGHSALDDRVVIASLALFLVAMLATLRFAVAVRPTRWGLVLLAVQVAAGAIVASDLTMLVALQIPLVLRPRAAAVAFAFVTALMVAVGLAAARMGGFVAAGELANLPPSIQVGVTLGSVAGWQLVAFAGGMLAATEIRARRDVDRLMAELTLTHGLLEQRSREAERVHIARELHDALGHRLAALGVSLDLESRRAGPEAASALREARDSAQQLLADVRDVVGAMHREQPIDLKRAVAALVSGLVSPEIVLTVTPGFDERVPARAHALLRAAQEALTNVLRHARATRVRVELAQDAGGTTLRVRDDGVGASPVREGHGLRGMRERIEALGGRLAVGSSPGGGLEIAAWLPPAERAR